MLKYIIRRLLQAIPTFFGITILSFILISNVSGSPAAALTANDPRYTPEQREAIAARMGANDPWVVQYLRWLVGDDWMRRDTDGDGLADTAILIALDADSDGEPEPPGEARGILRGDFGRSFSQRQPVMELILERIPATLELGISALIVSVTIGVPIGIFAAVYRGNWFDSSTRVMAVIFNALPGFWLGLILLLVFGSWLGWLPMGGQCPDTLLGGCPPLYERLNRLLLPTFVLATGGIATYSRYMRASMLDVIGQDYMRTAHSKGLVGRQVWFRHGARNAFIPLATFLGPAIAGLLSGAAITERVFSWPGLGLLAIDAVTQRDYPIVMAVVIITSIATILGYLLSDIIYAIVDPRIRFD